MKKGPNQWLCSDRELLLRSKLEAGWSAKSCNFRTKANATCKEEELEKSNATNQITDLEQEMIVDVLQRSQKIDQMEQKRIGKLLERLKAMRRTAKGDHTDQSSCAFCSSQFSFFLNPHKICNDCRKYVCGKCSLTVYSSNKKKLLLCKLCNETREIYKKSGSWFFNNSLPNFKHHLRACTLPDNSQPLEDSEKAAETRRCSSEQAYYEILTNSRFQLSPKERKSPNFLDGSNYQPTGSSGQTNADCTEPSQSEPTNEPYKSAADQSDQAHSSGHLPGPLLDSTTEEPSLSEIVSQALDQTSHQASVQSLSQTLGESLERNLEQSQQQPILFRTKELEKCRELGSELNEFISDDCVLMMASHKPNHHKLDHKPLQVEASNGAATGYRDGSQNGYRSAAQYTEASRIGSYPNAFCHQSAYSNSLPASYQNRTVSQVCNPNGNQHQFGHRSVGHANPIGRQSIGDAGNHFGQTNQMKSISSVISQANQTICNPVCYGMSYGGNQHPNGSQLNGAYSNGTYPYSLNSNLNSSLHSNPYQMANTSQKTIYSTQPSIQQASYQLNNLKISPTAEATYRTDRRASISPVSPISQGSSLASESLPESLTMCPPTISPTGNLMVPDQNAIRNTLSPNGHNQSVTYTAIHTSPTHHINPFGQVSNPFMCHTKLSQTNLSATNLSPTNLPLPTSGGSLSATDSSMNQSSSIGSKISQLFYGQGQYLANYRAMLTGGSSSKAQLAASYSQQNVVFYTPTSPEPNGLRASSHTYLQVDCSAGQASPDRTNPLAHHPTNRLNAASPTSPASPANQIGQTNQMHLTNHLNPNNQLNPANHPNAAAYGPQFQSSLNVNSLIRSLCSPVRNRQSISCNRSSFNQSAADNPKISSMNQANLLNGCPNAEGTANYKYI